MKFYTTFKISENIHETPEGYLVCIGVPIARTGELEYGPDETPLEVGPDGKVVVHREDSEVFRPETMASFEGKAITIGHPSEFISPANWKQLACGIVQNVRRGEGNEKTDLIADLLVTDQVAIGLVKSGLREVSCGYDALYEQTGEGRGTQSEIIGNHLALVREGRAGAAYAINDHKGKGLSMTLKEKIKAVFARAQDEAMSLAADAEPAKAVAADAPSKDAAAFDELKGMVADLGAKIAAMGKPADASAAAAADEPAKVVAVDQPGAAGASAGAEAVSMEDRMAKLEAMVAQLLEGKAQAGDESEESEDAGESEESEESEDAGESEESEDDDFEESTMTGDAAMSDAASRMEILAPGLKAAGKDAKAQALKAAYATTDGKAVIDQLTGGKAPDLKDPAKVNMVFIAASELLKASRVSALAKTKTQVRDFSSALDTPKGAMTAEQMNELNAKHYARKN